MEEAYANKANLVARHVATATTNAVVLRSGPCRFNGTNNVGGATGRWIKIYDLDREPLPSDTPVFMALSFVNSPGTMLAPPKGIWLRNGLAIRITANAAPTDDTAVSAGDVDLRCYFMLD